ncbi:Acyl-coenzyme A synthetase/AMP-(fatty) acid ligase [Rheinheimera pacifica]|uniref:Acyl-coenzyme A synthetase/AMP-(Fatty) acid ligase n=1 Tax=Rheinheimera pacifica TaxID=173990 RepID=A0A1H6JYL6_9GAMM|nr:AMP-binding protein [Rheinheimera pacifica]SEH66079.1 Acyl-coenzyme A synthetase/AMP-(fatty) acid ligase [Rheinheimera pacifica]
MLKQLAKHWQLSWSYPAQAIILDDHHHLSYQQWHAMLPAAVQYAGSQPGDTVLLYQPDSLCFSLWFVALAMLGKHIVLAPDNQPHTTHMVLQHCDWQVPAQLQPVSVAQANIPLQLLLSKECRISFFTSGSSGQPKLISKRLCQLLLEVQTLEQQFGNQLDANTLFAATVSQQHIYGLLFRLLWPLCNNRPLYRQQLSFFEQWQALLQQNKVVLVASPAHLARFDDIAKISPLQQQVSRIFSSGGPLPAPVPVLYQQAVGQAPTEVFGSTETGGIAFRQRNRPDVPWQAFTGVTLATDAQQALQVMSPHLENNAFFQTQDQVQLITNQQFHLLGRLDRIVKLAEKRLALPELEQFCCSSELVTEAAAVMLATPKAQLALVAVLSATGTIILRDNGKLAVNNLLKQHLLQRFEPVLLPKRFRYLTALPYNQQGKLPQSLLEALFTDD